MGQCTSKKQMEAGKEEPLTNVNDVIEKNIDLIDENHKMITNMMEEGQVETRTKIHDALKKNLDLIQENNNMIKKKMETYTKYMPELEAIAAGKVPTIRTPVV